MTLVGRVDLLEQRMQQPAFQPTWELDLDHTELRELAMKRLENFVVQTRNGLRVTLPCLLFN